MKSIKAKSIGKNEDEAIKKSSFRRFKEASERAFSAVKNKMKATAAVFLVATTLAFSCDNQKDPQNDSLALVDTEASDSIVITDKEETPDADSQKKCRVELGFPDREDCVEDCSVETRKHALLNNKMREFLTYLCNEEFPKNRPKQIHMLSTNNDYGEIAFTINIGEICTYRVDDPTKCTLNLYPTSTYLCGGFKGSFVGLVSEIPGVGLDPLPFTVIGCQSATIGDGTWIPNTNVWTGHYVIRTIITSSSTYKNYFTKHFGEPPASK